MGTTHLQAWRNVPGAQIAAVCSKDAKKLTGDLSAIEGNLGNKGEVFDFTNTAKYQDTRALLADTNVEAVDICLPTHLHVTTAIEAVKAGKHVLIEKPIALEGDEADALIDQANRRGVTLMTGQVLRFLPAYRGLSDALASRQYGPVRSALFRRRCAAPAWNAWLGDASKSGGGVFDLLIHDVDMALKLFGRPRFVSATGYEDLSAGIDHITAQLHYADVPSVVITGGWHHKKAYPFSMEYTVITDGATFDYSSKTGEANVYSGDGGTSPLPVPAEDGFTAQLAYFHHCASERKYPELCPPEDSAAAVRLTRLMLEARKLNGDKLECEL